MELDGLKCGRLGVGDSAVDAHLLRDTSAQVVGGIGYGVRHTVRAGVLRCSLERGLARGLVFIGDDLNVGQAYALDLHGQARRGIGCGVFRFNLFAVVDLVVDVERECELRLGDREAGSGHTRLLVVPGAELGKDHVLDGHGILVGAGVELGGGLVVGLGRVDDGCRRGLGDEDLVLAVALNQAADGIGKRRGALVVRHVGWLSGEHGSCSSLDLEVPACRVSAVVDRAGGVGGISHRELCAI